MKARLTVLFLLATTLLAGAGEDDPLDRFGRWLTFSSADQAWRARLSGLADAEQYWFDRPAPGFFSTDAATLFAPRVSAFLDAQLGEHVYFFAQGRLDRGFDPGDDGWEGRLDEYALRLSFGSARRVHFQAGKFATVVGNWVRRHDSWTNPFITAPLPYENVTGMFDAAAAPNASVLRRWANLGPGPFPDDGYLAELRIPILWGPSYATGASVAGTVGSFDYALETKNASPSSRPSAWSLHDSHWEHPTWSGRLGFRPSVAWNLGLSASSGSYLLPAARTSLPPGRDLGDYRQTMLAQDVSYAWRHLQLWAEVFASRFEIPRVGHADVFAYYVEAKYRFSPSLSGAIRWNAQLYGTVPDGGRGAVPWGRDTWRIDVAPAYRFSPHLQLKLQYSWQHHPLGLQRSAQLLGTQLSLRF